MVLYLYFGLKIVFVTYLLWRFNFKVGKFSSVLKKKKIYWLYFKVSRVASFGWRSTTVSQFQDKQSCKFAWYGVSILRFVELPFCLEKHFGGSISRLAELPVLEAVLGIGARPAGRGAQQATGNSWEAESGFRVEKKKTICDFDEMLSLSCICFGLRQPVTSSVTV